MSGQRVYFLSDVHLGVADRETERRKETLLVELLDAVVSEGKALYILGDLFDFWFEYRHVVPRDVHRTLAALDAVTTRGIPVVYLAGNHDFAVDGVFRDMGITLVPDAYRTDIDGKRFYLFHGDGLAERDGGYRLMKRVIRHPLSRFAFRWLHPDLGFRLARLFSHSSRDYTSAKSFGETDGMHRHAAELIAGGTDYVVMGHRHLPVYAPIAHGAYVNLGDWMTAYTYGVFEDGRFALYTRVRGREEPFDA